LDNTLRRTDEAPHVTVGCKTFSGIKGEVYSYRVSENGMLRKIFGPDGDEVAGDCRKLHTEKLYDFHSPSRTGKKAKEIP
jgi:hypothetical protein